MKKTFIFAGFSFISFVVLATIASATGGTSIATGATTLANTVNTINTTIVKAVGTLFLSMAVVAFFWGVVQYIWGLREGTPDKITKGNQFMVWGLVALFVMFSVYGIINYAGSIFGITPGGTITIPDIIIKGSNGTGAGTGNGGSLAPGMGYCADGRTQYSLATGAGGCPQTYKLCPDNVTRYYNDSDRSTVCGNVQPTCSAGQVSDGAGGCTAPTQSGSPG